VSRPSLVATFVVLLTTGVVPVVTRLLTIRSRLPVRRRTGAVNAAAPAPVRGSAAAADRRTRRRVGNACGVPRPREAETLGADPRRNQRTRRYNALADRGHGYVL
jgi:hypothetical protein